MRTAILFGAVCALSSFVTEIRAQYDFFLDGSTLPGSAGWTVEQDAGTIVDLGDGNSGIQQTDADTSGTAGIHGKIYDEYYLTLEDTSGTLATRFRIDSYDIDPQFDDRPINSIELTMGGSPTPAIGIGIRAVEEIDHWMLMRFVPEAETDPPLPEHYLADLGPVVLGEFNEARIYIENDTDLVRFF